VPRPPDPLEAFLAGQLGPRTRQAYGADLQLFFAFLGAVEVDLTALRQIDFQNVVAFRNHLAARGYRSTSINRKLCSIRAFFRVLVAAGHVERNPADPALVKGYKVDETLTGKALATRALRAILRSINTEVDPLVRTRDRAIFHLLVLGGLRRSEAARVQWDDLLQEGVYHVLRLPVTKSGMAQEIKLQPLVVDCLEAYRRELVRHGHPTNGHVFISLSRNQSHGAQLTDQSINLIVKRHALKAGVPRNITAHMFRHTCCTLAIEGGAKPQQVQAHLRHKDLKTTMRYYENRERLIDNASDYIHLG
jgi:integrase/recombinase XerD